MAFESNSKALTAGSAEDRLRNRGLHFHLVPSAHDHAGRRKASCNNNNGCVISGQNQQPVPVFPRFMLMPPTISNTRDCKNVAVAVHLEWVRGRGSAWISGCPEVAYIEDTNTFQLVPSSPSVPVTESGLAATLDTLEDVALGECLAQHLTEGGDDRLHLAHDTGLNKYYCPPRPVGSHCVIRGSCTCSPPSRNGFEAARMTLRRLWKNSLRFEQACDDIRLRISDALGVQEPHEVVLHPSGSDAELIPLLIGAHRARELGCSAVVNIVVAAGEVGSGTAPAAGGRHFSKFTPNGAIVTPGELITSFPEKTEVIEIKARLGDGSIVPNFDALVTEAMNGASNDHRQPFFILHAVDGSKTGLRLPSHELIDMLRAQYGEHILIVLDACQGRSNGLEFDWYLRRNCVVLFTGSKFFGAPGFCGAVLIPKAAAALLISDNEKAVTIPDGLRDYITKHEVPQGLRSLHMSLPDRPMNVGLLLRWTCAVAEMERFARLGEGARRSIQAWVDGVRGLVRARGPFLELLEGSFAQVHTGWDGTRLGGVNSVVSIKFLTRCGAGYLEVPTLRRVHRWLTMDASHELPAYATAGDRAKAALCCFVGQPVNLGGFGVLRLAIGAPLACELAGNDQGHLHKVLDDDSRILEKMMVLAKYSEDM